MKDKKSKGGDFHTTSSDEMQSLEFVIPLNGKTVRIKKFILDLKLKFQDRVYLGHANNLPFYIHVCCEHGYQVDYPHGYEDRLDCEVCRFNQLIEWRFPETQKKEL